jgi:hypothetical protein
MPIEWIMSEPNNPYQAPEEDPTPTATESKPAGTAPVARTLEYAIAILLIIALIGVFVVFFVANTVSWLGM